MAAHFLIFLLSMNYAFSYAYPFYGGGRTFPLVSARRQLPYLPIPDNSRVAEYPIADYDDAYIPNDHLEFDYYDKYDPYTKFGRGSYAPIYRPAGYYREKIPRKNWERMSYYDDPAPQDPVDDDVDGMYADDSWYDDAANAETNRAFLRNLMLAQMYEDAKNPSSAYRYDIENEDYNGRKYDYGIPTTKLAEKEKVRRYFQENGNEDVQELKALARKQGKSNEIKDIKTTEKPKNVNEIADTPPKTKAKLSDAENYFNLQKQLILNSRKSNGGQVAEGLRLEKKRMYDSMTDSSKYFDFEPFDETTTNSIKKLNMIKGKEMMKEMPSTSTIGAELLTTASPQKLANIGQKEVVLPRPSSPARRPYPEISTRSMNPPSVYDTIKKLLDMEKDAENKVKAQPQKRFVTDDPLTAELNELKKQSG